MTFVDLFMKMGDKKMDHRLKNEVRLSAAMERWASREHENIEKKAQVPKFFMYHGMHFHLSSICILIRHRMPTERHCQRSESSRQCRQCQEVAAVEAPQIARSKFGMLAATRTSSN